MKKTGGSTCTGGLSAITSDVSNLTNLRFPSLSLQPQRFWVAVKELTLSYHTGDIL